MFAATCSPVSLLQFVGGKVEMQDKHIKNQSMRSFELQEEHKVWQRCEIVDLFAFAACDLITCCCGPVRSRRKSWRS